MRAALLACALHLLVAAGVCANGGPFMSGVPSTGSAADPSAREPTPVALDEERVVIRLMQEFAEVEVTYQMHNHGPAREQPFYFPIRRWPDVPGEPNFARLWGAPRDVSRYSISARGIMLEATEVNDSTAGKGAAPRASTIGTQPVRVWKRSALRFAAEEKLEVRITYRAPYARDGAVFSDERSSGPAIFSYELAPAAGWRGGIGRGEIIVINEVPEREHARIERPTERFRREGENRWRWSFAGLTPTLDDDIRIVTAPAEEELGGYVLRGKEAWLSHAGFTVTATSSLPPSAGQSYEPERVRRGPGAWAEGVEGDGIGESLTLTVERPKPLDALMIIPGYSDYRHPEYWDWNNRVAGCEITLNGERTFRVEIPDYRYQDPYPIPIRGYAKPVRTVKLTITAVHRGTHFQDTCISSLRLRNKLAKVPKLKRKGE